MLLRVYKQGFQEIAPPDEVNRNAAQNRDKHTSYENDKLRSCTAALLLYIVLPACADTCSIRQRNRSKSSRTSLLETGFERFVAKCNYENISMFVAFSDLLYASPFLLNQGIVLERSVDATSSSRLMIYLSCRMSPITDGIEDSLMIKKK